jgi:hypothetical protein
LFVFLLFFFNVFGMNASVVGGTCFITSDMFFV